MLDELDPAAVTEGENGSDGPTTNVLGATRSVDSATGVNSTSRTTITNSSDTSVGTTGESISVELVAGISMVVVALALFAVVFIRKREEY